jgi:hypothetical protein
MTAMHEFVVPKSMPKTLAINISTCPLATPVPRKSETLPAILQPVDGKPNKFFQVRVAEIVGISKRRHAGTQNRTDFLSCASLTHCDFGLFV